MCIESMSIKLLNDLEGYYDKFRKIMHAFTFCIKKVSDSVFNRL